MTMRSIFQVPFFKPNQEDSEYQIDAEIDWMIMGVQRCLENRAERGSSYVSSNALRKKGALFYDWISPEGEHVKNKSAHSTRIFKTGLNGTPFPLGGFGFVVPKKDAGVKLKYSRADIRERSCFIPLEFAEDMVN